MTFCLDQSNDLFCWDSNPPGLALTNYVALGLSEPIVPKKLKTKNLALAALHIYLQDRLSQWQMVILFSNYP